MIELYNGDCLDIMKNIPDKSIDLILTDPPYQQEAHGRGIASKRKIYTQMAEYTNLDVSFFKEPSTLLKEFERICKFPNYFIFCGKRELYDLLKHAVDNNLSYHILPLCKTNPVPFTNNTWLTGEFSVHITDRKITYSKMYDDKIPYFFVNNTKVTEHPNEKNLSDVERIIKNLTLEGHTVLDCFMGSGTTGVACKNLNRKFIGIELNQDFFNMAKNRIETTTKKFF